MYHVQHQHKERDLRIMSTADSSKQKVGFCSTSKGAHFLSLSKQLINILCLEHCTRWRRNCIDSVVNHQA